MDLPMTGKKGEGMQGLSRGCRAILALALVLGTVAGGWAETDLNEIRGAHAALRDLSMTIQRKEVRESELRRMKRHAEMALEFPRIRVFFAAPDRLRMEGKRGLVPVTLIQNGNVKRIRFGLLHKRQDVTGQADKKQGGLDFGLLTEQVWTDFRVTREGRQPWEDRAAVVLHLVARSSPQGSYHRVWVDEETLRVLQIEDRTAEGELKRRYVFRRPAQTPDGIWLARRIEVFNQYEKFVGALELTDVVVNQGLDKALFGG
jgi:outer membrane lipoprotein-sorting protein